MFNFIDFRLNKKEQRIMKMQNIRKNLLAAIAGLACGLFSISAIAQDGGDYQLLANNSISTVYTNTPATDEYDTVLVENLMLDAEVSLIAPNEIIRDELALNFTGFKKGMKLSLYDHKGKLVVKKEIESANESIDFTNMHYGVYFLKIKYNGNTIKQVLLH